MRVNTKKLLNSKWTAVHPVRKEKHFLITEVEFNEEGAIIHCLMEAVITRRSFPIEWRELRNNSEWITGWK
jgi:tryptophan-rich hypothetical protein